jgi:hypothetical protein
MENMHEVKISGNDLNYFSTIVSAALRGDYGRLEEVTVTVVDNGRLQFATNDVASSHFGRAATPLEPTDGEGFPPAQGTGNPYANVSEDDSDGKVTKGQRLRQLESDVAALQEVVRRAEQMLNVRLTPR